MVLYICVHSSQCSIEMLLGILLGLVYPLQGLGIDWGILFTKIRIPNLDFDMKNKGYPLDTDTQTGSIQ